MNRKQLINFLLSFNPQKEVRTQIGYGSVRHITGELFVSRHPSKNHLQVIAINNRGYSATTIPENKLYDVKEIKFYT